MTIIDKLAWLPIKDRKALYVRTRGNMLFYNCGGKRIVGETDAEALVREGKEELTVDILPETMQLIGKFSSHAAGKAADVMVESTCYLADYTGTLTPNSEIEEMAWFTSGETERTTEMGNLILQHLKQQDLID